MTERPKRIRRDPETARNLILDEAERLMIENGYASVSSRRIAKAININAATVHYHFPTMDDVFIALHQRMSERQLAELRQVLQADDPLLAYWQFQSTWEQATLGVELLALCNHRKSLRERLAASADAARNRQVDDLRHAIADGFLLPNTVDALAVATILTAIGRLLVNEQRVGMTAGHEAVRALVTETLARLSVRKA